MRRVKLTNAEHSGAFIRRLRLGNMDPPTLVTNLVSSVL
jgi:hypothetical protein